MPPRFVRLPSILADRLPSFVPGCCALCGDSGNGSLCSGCDAQFFGAGRRRCACCASPLPEAASSSVCGACIKQPPAFDATIVAADYAAPVDQLVLALKFGNQLALAPLFGRLLQRALSQAGMEKPDLLTAVPLGMQRLGERGFNQALEIARPIARTIGARLGPSLLLRVRDTRAQS